MITVPSELEGIESIGEKIKTAVPNNFIVNNITYESDVSFEEKEFLYLIGFKNGDKIGVKELHRAVSCLIKKNKFEKIMLAICPCKGKDRGCKTVHFGLTGSWTFKKLKIYGVWVGRYEYSKYYSMEPGDLFSVEKHNHAIKKIKDLLQRQGYFNGNVSGDIKYDAITKSVSVDLILDRGAKFSVGAVNFIVKSGSEKEIAGLEKIRNKMRELFVKIFAKSPYSKALINRETRALKRYLSKKGFLHVDIELVEKIDYKSHKVDLQFTITLHSKKEFIFFGNSFFSNTELLDKILIYGRSAWLVPGTILSGEIIKEYHKHGFWEAQIQTKEEERGYFFLIKEGERAAVTEIELLGIKSFEHDLLVRTCFTLFLRAKHFDQLLLEKALDKLLSFYVTSGFWDIKLLKQEFKKIDNANKYKLIISLDEGERSYLQSVSLEVKNNKEVSKEQVSAILEKELFAAQNIPFDIQILSEQKNWLVKYFKDKGYLGVEVTPELIRDGQQVKLKWIVSPGALVTFGKTIVLGSRIFPIDYIMRELQYKEGDVWNNEKLKASVARLRSLGIFEHAHLYPYRVAVTQKQEDMGQKDILLKLYNADPYEIRTRVGLARYGIDKEYIFGQGFTYKLGGAFLWKNPMSAADQFIVDFDLTRSYRNVCASYCRPWMFGCPVKTTFKVYANKYEQPGFICSKKNIYEAKQDGFLVGFNRVYKKVDFSFTVGAEWMATIPKEDMLRQVRTISRVINFESCLLGKKIPYLLLEPTVLINAIDDKLNPRSGFFTLISLKSMFPLKREFCNSYFIKLMVEQSVFYSFYPKLVLALRVRFGHIFHQQFKNIMPIERFYLGGAHSVRSYEKDMCPPWGIFCDKERDFPDDIKKTKTDTYNKHTKYRNLLVIAPQGGKTMANINLEARFDIYKAMSGVIFQDLGLLVGDKFNIANISAATGLGIRFNSILGPLRFDIAWKWRVRKKFESRYAWFLAFGNAF